MNSGRTLRRRSQTNERKARRVFARLLANALGERAREGSRVTPNHDRRWFLPGAIWALARESASFLVGEDGFEPPTPCV